MGSWCLCDYEQVTYPPTNYLRRATACRSTANYAAACHSTANFSWGPLVLDCNPTTMTRAVSSTYVVEHHMYWHLGMKSIWRDGNYGTQRRRNSKTSIFCAYAVEK